MNWIDAALAFGPALLLLLIGMLPKAWCDRHIPALCRWVPLAGLAALVMALVATGVLIFRGTLDVVVWQVNWPVPMGIGVYFDQLAAALLLLINFIGWIVLRFSVRYLDGEATQGRFLKWMCVTLGGVMLLVVSRNLVMFTAAWMLASFGLHRLLTHYEDRPWGIWAARKKFLISRLGDVLLIGAIYFCYQAFGTSEYPELFAAAQAIRDGDAALNSSIIAIGVLLALGALTKSAQVPFHSWLPDTMEAPTPVSALMHAGIINAGGVLIIRFSPLVSLSAAAMNLLIVVGTLTAVFGAVVMLTQTSIKRALAYSTVAQMGFMILQCGLGAFVPAVLHLIAHSAYKAHAFLSSGSVLDVTPRVMSIAPVSQAAGSTLGRSMTTLFLAGAIATVIIFGAAWTIGLSRTGGPSAAVLALILGVALTQLIWGSLRSGITSVAWRGIAAAVGVCAAYLASYHAVAALMGDVIVMSNAADAPSLLAVCLVGATFIGVLILQIVVTTSPHLPFAQSLYAHASNAFYLETYAQRLTAKVWRQAMPIH